MQTTNWQELITSKFSRALRGPSVINEDKQFLSIASVHDYLEVSEVDEGFQIVLCRTNKLNEKEYKTLSESNPLELTTTIAHGWETSDGWESE